MTARSRGRSRPASVAGKRDASHKILVQGDWCSATNQPGGCTDALRFSAGFAAQGVTIQ